MVLLGVSIGFWNWAKLISAGILAYFVYGVLREKLAKTRTMRVAVAFSSLIIMALSYSLYKDFSEWWGQGPTGMRLFAANPGPGQGSFIVDGQTYELGPGEGTEISLREGTAPHKVVGMLGSKVVLDTLMGDGSYVGSLSPSRTVEAEHILFSDGYLVGLKSQGTVHLRGPGIVLFTPDPVIGVYGFDEEVSEALSVRSGQHTASLFSVKIR